MFDMVQNKMIAVYKNDMPVNVPTFLEALNTVASGCGEKAIWEENPVISVVGAGGKTTLLHCMADEFVQKTRNVFVTTTTHVMMEDSPCFLADPDMETIKNGLKQFGQVWAGMSAPGRKLKKLPDEVLSGIFDWKIPVLIEADGARRMPLKAPAGHEPVIYTGTTHVLSVYGMDAVGKTFGEICFRWEYAVDLLKKKKTDAVTEKDIAVLASSDKAGRKGCPADAVYAVVLNKADNPGKMESALCICRELKKRGVGNVIISSRQEGRE